MIHPRSESVSSACGGADADRTNVRRSGSMPPVGVGPGGLALTGEVTRGTLVAAQAELWVGVPFHWQGRVRAGCDCKGLVAGIAAELGFAEADSLEALVADYGDVVPATRLRAGLAAVFDRVPVTERQAGDVLLCRVHGRAQHLAIAAPREFSPGRVIEALLDARQVQPFKRPVDTVDSAWRWKDLSEGVPTPPQADGKW